VFDFVEDGIIWFWAGFLSLQGSFLIILPYVSIKMHHPFTESSNVSTAKITVLKYILFG
jgi:hypothetical protein